MKESKLLLGLLLMASLSWGQELAPAKWEFKGYIKEMATITFDPDSLSRLLLDKNGYVDNLVHNRIMVKWYPNDNLTLYFDVRNRWIVGDQPDLVNRTHQLVPNLVETYGSYVDTNNDFLDLSYMPYDKKRSVIHSMIDRAYIEWTKGSWEVSLGRQRINWGTNLAWNPNDLFNAYNFFDFDYEERPGSDALRVVYYSGFASSIEFAAKAAKENRDIVAALLWKINRWNYDFQFLGGVAQNDLTFGTGWAGNLGTAGFKGEFTYFNPLTEDNFGRKYDQMLIGSTTIDYSFPNSFYINGAVLYNSEGAKDTDFSANILAFSTEPFTVRDLSPFKWTTFVQTAYTFHPLINGGISIMGYPGGKALYLNPYFTFSVAQSIDLDLVGQLFYDQQGDSFEAISKQLFIRTKWSF